ncbi:hypothetical protein J2S40_001366 [Nocardioides luteus]|uniref:EcsC family protein n=1 Tax=Nocardioides luteus TaxID=1844 RepID=A0ABQ5T0B9_9ACTN|nr:EcsC family protein [Nocardioides luteus]MDR7310308.1 hypothetical protein [Nocardioides luteus]GGR53567.1 hypothetical protein GCM10010197_19970 [Nocardioides luteus]GLJ69913.1 hypothetical protein GCM10017579_39490 [Nocardioides luteus]
MDSDAETKSGALDKVGTGLVDQLMKVIDDGIGPMNGARAYADSRIAMFEDPEKAILRIIAETTAASGSAGFVTSLGGFITMPVTIPVNITGQAILNARMVGAIAHLRGWNLDDESVRYAILVVIAGGSPNAVLAEFGKTLSRKLTETAIKRLPMEAVRAINKKVGFMLVAKYGTKRSLVTLSKGVPLIGGVVGGSFDAAFTTIVARAATKAFPSVALESPGSD